MGSWLEAPAGQHGFLSYDGAKLQFEDGTPIKFWGVNISSSDPFSEKAEVDEWVKTLSKYGINGVRFHKFTNPALKGSSSTVLDPKMMERFDYFGHALREKGIYYGWSHIYGHKVKPDDASKLLNYKEIVDLSYPWSHLNGTTSGLINFAEDLQDLSIELTVNMLNHINPNNGLRYADDPALIFIELQNEDNIFWSAIEKALEQAPTYRQLLCNKFSEWLKNKYGSQKKLLENWGRDQLKGNEHLDQRNIYPEPNHSLFSWHYTHAHQKGDLMPRHILDKMEFLYATQNEFYTKFTKAIRATGYRGVIVASCWQAGMGPSHYYNLHADYRTGMIDRHNYAGGGKGHHMKPGPFKTTPMLSQPGSGLLSTGMQQIVDRPFSISEWMGLIPTEWVAESVPIIGFYGMGLQGWDASFHFNNSQPRFTHTIHTPGIYNVNSPTQLTLYPAIARSVYRGDVNEAELVSTRNVSIGSLSQGKLGFFEKVEQGFDNKYITGDIASELLAVGKTAIAFTSDFKETKIPELSAYWDQQEEWVQSITGELFWNYGDADYITVDTPSTQGAIGFTGGKTLNFKDFEMTVDTPFSVVLATALGKQESIDTGKNILITAIARAVNSGMTYNSGRTELLTTGEAPILMEPVDLTIKLNSKRRPTVYILDHVGRRTGKTLPVKGNEITINGTINQTIYYELTFE